LESSKKGLPHEAKYIQEIDIASKTIPANDILYHFSSCGSPLLGISQSALFFRELLIV
jgi:hypothetical protein